MCVSYQTHQHCMYTLMASVHTNHKLTDFYNGHVVCHSVGVLCAVTVTANSLHGFMVEGYMV